MTPDEFRRHGHEMIEWIARYMEQVERYPVLSPADPGDVRAELPEHPPEDPEPFSHLMRDVDEIIVPGVTHWQSPNFFAYFPANASGPSILGDLLSSGLGVQGMLWATSPACTELETLMLDWLVEMLDLPQEFHSSTDGGGVLQDTASSAALCALLAARERASEFAVNEHGVGATGKKLIAYTSSQTHSSVEKGVKIAGLGRENLRLIDVDQNFALRPEALEAAIHDDLDAGRQPFFVCGTVGSTSSTAIDPLPTTGAICRAHGLWFHVDAAFAGPAALCPELRWIQEGLEYADSYTFNPHKWMLTNFDCNAFYVRDRATLIKTLTVLPEYLRNQATESGAVFDYRDWHIPLGRRFRALKLWFVIRTYGVSGLRQKIRDHVAWAQEFAQEVEAHDDFELAAPAPLSLVCFRHRGGDEINQKIMDDLNRSGRIYLTHTKLNGKLTLRLAIGSAATERRHVLQAWDRLRDTAEHLTLEKTP